MECVVVGYLTVRSTYLPRTLGVMMKIAGVCYVTNISRLSRTRRSHRS